MYTPCSVCVEADGVDWKESSEAKRSFHAVGFGTTEIEVVLDDVGLEAEDWWLDLGVEVQSEGSAFVGLLLFCCDGTDGWMDGW